MKSLQKRIAAGLLMAAILLASVFTSVAPADAATLTARQYITKMQKAVQKAKSYEVTEKETLKMNVAGQTMTETMTGNMIVFNKPVKGKSVVKSTVDVAGKKSTQKTVSYVKESKGKIYVYTKNEDGTYTKTDMTNIYQAAGSLNFGDCSDAKIVKKSVKVNKVDTVQISFKIKGKDIVEILEGLGISEENAASMGLDFNSMPPISETIWIDKKTYLPVKASVDMSKFINEFWATFAKILSDSMTETGSDGSDNALNEAIEITCSSAKAIITYKNFNKAANFKFPAGCK